jgi:dolichyl-diphosphooligosaccharide--protein glycosyltransferase
MNKNNKLLFSLLGFELSSFLFVLLNADSLLPISKTNMVWLSIISIAMASTIVWLYFNNKDTEFYQKHKNKFYAILTILLIMLPMIYAGYIRSYSYTLPTTDDWAKSSIEANLKNQIAASVKSEYPNLGQDLINRETEKRYTEFISDETNAKSMAEEQERLSTYFREQFQADNKQTYLLEIDPYYYNSMTNNLLDNSIKGDKITSEGDSIFMKRLAPTGQVTGLSDFHTWIELKMYKLYGITSDSTSGEKTHAVYFLPVLFSILCVIPIFFIIRLYSNNSNLFAFIGSLTLVSISTFIYRTMAGFVDTDAYNIFFPLIIMALIVYSLNAKKTYVTISLAAIAGIVQTIYAWAWGNSWFAFLFIFAALSMYLAYNLFVELIKKASFIELLKNTKTELITLTTFLISSIVISSIFLTNIFATAFNNVFKIITGNGGFSDAKIGNIWPNVFSSVGELNPASFSTIIDSVGGKIIFIVALFGIMFLLLDSIMSKNANKFKKDKHGNFINISDEKIHKSNKIISISLYSFALIWFSFFIFNFNSAGILASFHNSLIALTNNNSLLFVVLLLLPIILATIFAIYNKLSEPESKEKIFVAFLLTIWIGGTIFMSFQGARFVLLLCSAFAIAFALGAYYLAKLGNTFIPKSMNLDHVEWFKYIGSIFVLFLFIVSFIPIAIVNNQMALGAAVPGFDDQWHNLMYKINDNSNTTAIITSWWDFGHFFINVADRGATFDGGAQRTPQSHWVGKFFMENDEEVAHDILQMLVCGGNEAFDLMLEKSTPRDTTEGVLINKIIYQTLGKTNEEKISIIKNNKYNLKYTDEDITQIMEKLSCNAPVEDFVIASEDMVSKSAVWAHWGSWDFERKYVLDNYKLLSAVDIAKNIDEPVEEIETMISELATIDLKAQLQNTKRSDLVNMWLAPYPGYISIDGKNAFIPCTTQTNKENKTNTKTLNCQGIAIVDLNPNNLNVQFQMQEINVKNIVISQNNTITTAIQNEKGDLDVVVRETSPNSNTYELMITAAPLGNSMFTKLFYLNGVGLKHFDLFDETTTTTGLRIKTWKASWE